MKKLEFFLVAIIIATAIYSAKVPFKKEEVQSPKEDIFNANLEDAINTQLDELDKRLLNMAISLSIENEFSPYPKTMVLETFNMSDKYPDIINTTIDGGLDINNQTELTPDLNQLLSQGPFIELSKDEPQILIFHTHGSEAYIQTENSQYEESDSYRTQDKEKSIIRVGTELANCLESYGLNVVHDTGIYDYPSYNGCYERSGEVVQKYLEEYPSIKIVLDVHRDAIGNNDGIYRTVAPSVPVNSSQLMLLCGTGANGLDFPNWQDNLKLALYLQNALVSNYSDLARKITLVNERYNQHLSKGFLILEVGSNGNTLDEALNAARYFAKSVAPKLLDLVVD